ncbi:MAG TPA: metallopeptidase family protein [Candidatus Saccharimonadales bacterium]|nr:metallopeptidase family protein [Candidatus Saccharimonadales bacterium]
MRDISDDEFMDLIDQALSELPQEYVQRMKQNVAIVIADDPTLQQREQLKLRGNQTLFGLYEGLPLSQRYNGMTKITPDKITIFKNPILSWSPNEHALKEQIKHTVWHEMAHYFGLDHKRIHELE